MICLGPEPVSFLVLHRSPEECLCTPGVSGRVGVLPAEQVGRVPQAGNVKVKIVRSDLLSSSAWSVLLITGPLGHLNMMSTFLNLACPHLSYVIR